MSELGPLFIALLFLLFSHRTPPYTLQSCRMKTPFLDSTGISVHISYSRDNKTRHGGAHLLTHHLGRRIAMNSRPTLDTQEDTFLISMMTMMQQSDCLLEGQPRLFLCVLRLLHLRTPECCPECLFILFICFPPVQLSFQSFAKHSGQGQIKGLSWLRELNLTTKSLSPVKRLSVQSRNLPSDSCRERRRNLHQETGELICSTCPQVNLAEGPKHRHKCLRKHQNTWDLFLAFCVVLALSCKHFSFSFGPPLLSCWLNMVTFLLLQFLQVSKTSN